MYLRLALHLCAKPLIDQSLFVIVRSDSLHRIESSIFAPSVEQQYHSLYCLQPMVLDHGGLKHSETVGQTAHLSVKLGFAESDVQEFRFKVFSFLMICCIVLTI